MAKKTTKNNKKTTVRARAQVQATEVRPWVRRILTHVDTTTNTWKKHWDAQRVATKYNLTKMQVAAVLAHYNMGRYTK